MSKLPTRWYLQRKKNGCYCIFRYTATKPKVKKERYPEINYRSIKRNELEMNRLLERLNYSHIEEQKKKFITKSSFISSEDLEQFYEYLHKRQMNTKNARATYHLFKREVLDYFTSLKPAVPNFAKWIYHETTFLEHLMSQTPRKSKRTIEAIFASTNSFYRFIHQKTKPKGEKEVIKLMSISTNCIPKKMWNDYEAKRKNVIGRQAEKHAGEYINDDDWQKIEKSLPSDIKSQVWLAYYYGLRRAETLAITLEKPNNIFSTHLDVNKTLQKFSNGEVQFGLTKSKFRRKVPHWLNKDIKLLANIVKNMKLMSVDNLGRKWSEYMKEIKLDYKFHSLRNTFVSNCFREGIEPEEIRKAVGHENIKTTYQYQREYRKFDDKPVDIDKLLAS